MGIPKNHAIPTRKDWQKLRDKAGGKAGAAKVSVGDALDNFYKSMQKASKTDDPSLMTKEINALQKVVTAYVAEVGKKDAKLAKLAKEKIHFPLKDFIANCSSSDGEDKGQADTARHLESRIRDIKKYDASVADFIKKSEKGVKAIEANVQAGKIPDKLVKQLKEVHDALAKNLDKFSAAGVKMRSGVNDDLKKLGKDVDAKLVKEASTAQSDLDEAFAKVQDLKAKLKDLKKGLK